MAQAHNPICIALDTPEPLRAAGLARMLKPAVGYVKVGMELFYAGGPRAYETVASEGVPVFVDLKLHDIPNTVASALRSLMRLEPKPAIINVHASGGLQMMKAAAEAVDGRSKLIAVTVLTSLSDEDLWSAGFSEDRNSSQHAEALARLAASAGLNGVVCSPRDVAQIKSKFPQNFLAVVPGIRPEGSEAHDQKRVSTPREALKAGADILVIGRAITGASDPGKAARDIAVSLEQVDAG